MTPPPPLNSCRVLMLEYFHFHAVMVTLLSVISRFSFFQNKTLQNSQDSQGQYIQFSPAISKSNIMGGDSLCVCMFLLCIASLFLIQSNSFLKSNVKLFHDFFQSNYLMHVSKTSVIIYNN